MGAGEAVISVSLPEDHEHLATSTVTVPILVKGKTGMTASQFQWIVSSGLGPNVYSTGDRISPIRLVGTLGEISLNGTYYPQILGFNHNEDYEKDAENYVDLLFAASASNKYLSFKGLAMCDSGNYEVGWANTKMCQETLPMLDTVIQAEEWRDIIIPATKYTDNVGAATNLPANVTATKDRYWLTSEYEIYGTIKNSNAAEAQFQKQYDMFKNGASKVRYEHATPTTAAGWWFRSSGVTNAKYYCGTNSSGASINAVSTTTVMSASPCARIA